MQRRTIVEEFSKASFRRWQTDGEDLSKFKPSGGREISELNPTWDISSNSLDSLGDYHPWRFNFASIAFENSIGAWRIQISNPTNASDHSYSIFWIHLSEFRDPTLSNKKSDPGIYLYTNTWVSIVRFQDSAKKDGSIIMREEIKSKGKWIEYSLIRTKDAFLVFISDHLVFEEEMKEDVYHIRSLVLSTNQGSHVKFDKIRITSDYKSVLEELNHSIRSKIDFLIPILPLLVFSIVTLILYSRKSKMKHEELIGNLLYPRP